MAHNSFHRWTISSGTNCVVSPDLLLAFVTISPRPFVAIKVSEGAADSFSRYSKKLVLFWDQERTMSHPYQQYQKTAVTTASQGKILLLLYEGAIRLTRQAILAMNEKRIADKGKFISKATAIISELMATLDFKAGRALALDLENLYVFMIDKLVEGNIENKVEHLQAVDKLLSTLYTAWKDVIENPRPDGVPSPILQPLEYKKYLETKNNQIKNEKDKSNVSDFPPLDPTRLQTRT